MPPVKLTRRIASALSLLGALACAGAGTAAAPAGAVPGTPPGALATAPGVGRPIPAGAADYVTGRVLVGYAPRAAAAGLTHAALDTGTPDPGSPSQVVKVPAGESMWQAIAALKRQPDVRYAVPDYIAHQAGWIPNDPGNTHHRQGWQQMQWSFLSGFGVDAPDAWSHMFAAHRPGGRGVTIAVLDTGVAYRDWQQFRKGPDFGWTRFVDPYDFVAGNAFPLDREGHGTFLTGMIADSTNNGFGLTGLAYGARIMPIRVLDADGNGDSATIARGIRYAVQHGAQVINLSLQFDRGVIASEIPDVIAAIRFAHRRGVVVVAATGNNGSQSVDYPAAAPGAIAVGASTRDRCLADYSNAGPRLDLVAPGGGDDASLAADPDCHPLGSLPPIRQITFADLESLHPGADPAHFGYPGTEGTSMAAPLVSAAAALVIASGVIGRHPSPDQILARLEQTATPLGGAQPNDHYGWGLLNAGAATAPGPPKPL